MKNKKYQGAVKALYSLLACFPLIKPYCLHILLSMAFIGTITMQSGSN